MYIRLIGYDVDKIKAICEENGYLIRIFGGDNEKHLRITITTEEDMPAFKAMLIKAIEESVM